MNHDEIIKEVREIRERLSAQKNHDVRMLYEEAKQRQRECDRRVVRLKPRSPGSGRTALESNDV